MIPTEKMPNTKNVPNSIGCDPNYVRSPFDIR